MIILVLCLLTCFVFYLLFYPFKVLIWNENEYLYVKIAWIITVKINLLILFDNQHNDEIKRQAGFYKILNKIKIKSIKLKISGVNFNYEFGGQIFGYLNIILAILKNYLMMNNSEFNYDIRYMGERNIEFKGIIYSKMGTILKQIYGGNGYERASN